jgi:hypothetical protein
MPVLGIVASGYQAGAYEWIATVNGDGSTASLVFSSIPQTYKHLQIRGVANSAYSSVDNGALGVQFNGDTGTNYSRQGFTGGNSTIGNYLLLGTPFAQSGEGVFLQPSQPYMGVNVMDVTDYTSSSKQKTVRGLSGIVFNTSGGTVMYAAGYWTGTSPVTSLTMFQQNANFATGTTFSLYGIKG